MSGEHFTLRNTNAAMLPCSRMFKNALSQLFLDYELYQSTLSQCHCAVGSQIQKEPVESVAAGLRHSLAVTGKFLPKTSSVCFH